MSVKKFFVWTGHSCLKVLKNLTTSIQTRYGRSRFKNYSSMMSISTYGRGSISTEVTVLEFEPSPQKEASENEFNEKIERRWRSKYY